eukprot:gene39145-48346_t
MRRLWLLFAQAVTVVLALYFVYSAMRPDWQGLPGVPGLSTAPSLPAAGSARSTLLGGNVPPSPGSYRAAAAQAMPAVVNVLTTKAPRRKHPLTRDPFFKKFFGD